MNIFLLTHTKIYFKVAGPYSFLWKKCLCSAEERYSYRFGTRGWVNDDRILSLFKIIYLFWVNHSLQSKPKQIDNEAFSKTSHFYLSRFHSSIFNQETMNFCWALLCSPRPGKLWVKAWSLMYISSSTHSIMDWAVIVPSVNVFRSCIMEYSRVLSQNQLPAALHQKQIEAERLHLGEYNVCHLHGQG